MFPSLATRFCAWRLSDCYIQLHCSVYEWHCGTISKFLLYNPSKRRRVRCAGGHIYIMCIVHIKLTNFIFLALYTLSTSLNLSKLSQSNNNKYGPGGVFVIPKLKPLNSTKHCFECGEEFSLFKQKYHCRNCGTVL